MIKRWIIRGLALTLLTLCVVVWAGSYFRSAGIAFNGAHRLSTVDVEWGEVHIADVAHASGRSVASPFYCGQASPAPVRNWFKDMSYRFLGLVIGKSIFVDERPATRGQGVSEDPHVREAASKALLAAMPRCALLLREVKSEDPETTARIEDVLRNHHELQALEHYRRAFELRADADLKGDPTHQIDSQIGAKAGAQILAVLGRNPESAKKGESGAVTDFLETLKKKAERAGPQAE